MAFRTTDFKKTSRKAKDDAPAALYPHQMRDKKTLARLDIAIRLFDQMVGKRRGEMDAGALVDFFGDPRLVCRDRGAGRGGQSAAGGAGRPDGCAGAHVRIPERAP